MAKMESAEFDAEIQSLVTYGNNCFQDGDFENSIESLGDALKRRINKFGDMDYRCAELYFLYGRSLAESYRQNNGLFSEKSAQRREDKKSSKTGAGGEEDENSSNGSETESLVEDLKLAWENLEIARLIFEKDLKIEDYASYADVLVYLGIVMFESGLEEGAVAEFAKAIEFMSKDKNVSPKQFSVALFEYGLVEGFRNNYAAASRLFEQSRTLLNGYVLELKTNFSDNAEMINQVDELIAQLDDKIQDCNDCLKDVAVKKNQKKEPLPTISTEKSQQATEKGDDISHLVKRKAKDSQDASNAKKKVA